MNDMEKSGITTSAIRNRARRREYTKQRKTTNVTSLFTCCGADFVLADFTQPDEYEAQKEFEKQAYEEKKQAKLDREEKLRNDFGKIMRKKKQNKGNVDEAYEVVE